MAFWFVLKIPVFSRFVFSKDTILSNNSSLSERMS